MNIILKRLLIIFHILFTPYLLMADGDDIEISILDATSVYETDGKIAFTIELDRAPGWELFGVAFGPTATVYYSTADGSASATEDYIAQYNQPITFEGDETSKTIYIDLVDDNNHEVTQSMYVNITNSDTGFIVVRPQARAIIYDDDPEEMETTVNDVKATEGDSGTTYISFPVSLNQPAPAGGVRIDYTTTDNTAKKGIDFNTPDSYITIQENQNSGSIDIPLINDLEPEDTKKFYLNLTTSLGTLTHTQVIGTIYDNDQIAIDISCNDADEGDDISCRVFLRKELPASASSITIQYLSEEGSDPKATETVDYTRTEGNITFNSGDKEFFITVPTIQDTTIESDENMRMVIYGSNYIADSSSTGVIINDDGEYPGIHFNVSTVSVIEGNSSQTDLVFNLTLDAPAEEGTSFKFYTQDDTAKHQENDYEELNTTTYDIPEGERNVSITVKVNGDTYIEQDEAFYLRVGDGTHLTLSSIVAQGIILNDDGEFPKLSFNTSHIELNEGDSNNTIIDVQLSLDKPALAGSYFEYKTTNDQAKSSDNDFQEINTTRYTFNGGEENLSIPITINGDTKIEYDERFYFDISNDTNLSFGAGTTHLPITIINDDGNFSEFSIDANTTTFLEKDSNQTAVTFRIFLDIPSTEDTTIELKTVDGNAESNDRDYEKISIQEIEFKAGEQEKFFTTYINGDIKVEDDETFYIELLNPYHADLSSTQNSIEITIENDDVHTDDHFTCDNTMYISSSKKRGTNETGKMWLHKIDTTYNPFEFLVVEDNGVVEQYNATAYSEQDNFIYGLYFRELIKFTETGKMINLGKINGLPETFDTRQFYAGAIYNNIYYVSGIGADFDKIYKISLIDKNVTELNLTQAISIQDFSFSPDGKVLYGIADGGKFLTIDVSNGTVNQIGEKHTGYQFDSTFSDVNGHFFANDSNGNGFFEFDTTTGIKSFISASQPAEFNDGANCINAELIFTDYGDAPDAYPHVKHKISGNLYLGDNAPDHETDQQSTSDASGDGEDDNDSIVGELPTLTIGDTSYTVPVKVINKTGQDAYITAWIDFNRNNIFEFNEALNINDLTVHSSMQSQTVNIVWDDSFSSTQFANLTEGKTIMRIRLTTSRVLRCDSEHYSTNSDYSENYLFSPDGEIEDYQIEIASPFTPLRGRFNIERIDSGNYPINSDDRNSWYTQIVGRDFDYSMVFYEEDMSAEKVVSNLTLKVELVETKNQKVLYERYFHIPKTSTQSRFNIRSTNPNKNAEVDDLSEQSQSSLPSIPASRDVYFRVSYQKDASGEVIQSDCQGFTESDYKACYDNLPSTRYENAKDNFSIRPDRYYVALYDHHIMRQESINIDNTIRVASGYDYNLSVVATKFNTKDTPAKGYNKTLLKNLTFMSGSNCHNTTSPSETIYFDNGYFNDQNFTATNVGLYKLELQDDNNWTYVDQIKSDCIIEESNLSQYSYEKSGCNITPPNYDIEMSFYPYQFDLTDVNFSVLPIDDNEFIYMDTEINGVAAQLKGTIVAQNAKGEIASNFTNGCVAEDITLFLDNNITSDSGINQPLRTTPESNGSAPVPVRLNRSFAFNHTVAIPELEIEHINAPIIVRSNNFRDTNSTLDGSLYIDLRYNIAKNRLRTINPIEIGFKSLSVTSEDAYSKANMNSHWVPDGFKTFNQSRLFYFAQVAPDAEIYPRVHYSGSNIVVNTPISIDIFCQNPSNPNFCREMKIFDHTQIHASPRKQAGWYISTDHNRDQDGNVTLVPLTNSIIINPTDVPFTNGQNYMVNTTVVDANHSKNKVEIQTPPHLTYKDPNYVVVVTDNNSSQWAGIGKAGRVINTTVNTNQANKNDW